MNLTVIGTGYVGLVTSVCFAELGHQVVGVDEDVGKVERLQRGDPVIYEPGVEPLLRGGLEAGRLRFTTDIAEAVAASEVIFICVGTPPRDDGSADLSQVERVTRVIAERMDSYHLLIEKSTVPVKTARWIERTVKLYNRRGLEFDVASNTEFTREGTAVADFLNPDRIVIGVSSDRAARLLSALYANFTCPKIITDVNTAEIIKHASNSFLAMKISFANLMADLCERADARRGNGRAGHGPRSAHRPLFPERRSRLRRLLLPQGREGVHPHRRRVGSEHGLAQRSGGAQSGSHRQGHRQGATGAVDSAGQDDRDLGPGIQTQHRRCARLARPRARFAVAGGGRCAAPARPARPGPRARNAAGLRARNVCASALDAVEGAHTLIIATEWEEFKTQDVTAMRKRMATPIIIDGRNLLRPEDARAADFEYISVGRSAVNALH